MNKFTIDPVSALEVRTTNLEKSIKSFARKAAQVDDGSELINIKPFYTIKEVANMIGVSPYRIEKAVKLNQIKTKNIGDKAYISEESFRNFLEHD